MGIKDSDAKRGATVLTQSDLTGVRSHGLSRLPTYANKFLNKSINPNPNIKFSLKTNNLLSVDADGGLGIVSGPIILDKVIEIALMEGVCVCSVGNSYHYGVGNYYAWRFAQEGLIGLSLTNTTHHVAPFGGSNPIMGTNPITVGIPSAGDFPVILDIATSITAFSKIFVTGKEGFDIPNNWAIDKNGNPTTNPEEALKGAILPMAQHKGYALALIIEILTGILSAGIKEDLKSMSYKHDNSHLKEIGHLHIAIDVSKFLPLDIFKRLVNEYLDEIKNSSLAPGFTEILIPGEIESRFYQEYTHKGIPINPGLEAQLVEMVNKFGYAKADKLEDFMEVIS